MNEDSALVASLQQSSNGTPADPAISLAAQTPADAAGPAAWGVGRRPAWDAPRGVLEPARELPAPVPSAAHREEIRTALLAAGPGGERRARPGLRRERLSGWSYVGRS